MFRFAPHHLVLSTALLLAVSACQDQNPSSGSVSLETDQTSANDAPASEDTITETPESPSEAMSPSDNMALTLDGFGPYLIGSTTKENGLAPNTSSAGSESCSYIKLDDHPGLMFMIVENKLARIDVQSGDWAVKDGIKIGSSGDKIKASYGDALTVTPGKYDETISDYSVKQSDTRGAVFQVIDDEVSNYRIGRLPEVSWVEGCS